MLVRLLSLTMVVSVNSNSEVPITSSLRVKRDGYRELFFIKAIIRLETHPLLRLGWVSTQFDPVTDWIKGSYSELCMTYQSLDRCSYRSVIDRPECLCLFS